MAITAVHYRLYKELHAAGLLPQNGSILEIGEANWYNDFTVIDFYIDIPTLSDGIAAKTLQERVMNLRGPTCLFDAAKIAYSLFFNHSEIVSVDFNGTADALRQDLNEVLDLPKSFDTVINNGTAEHVFNIAQVFSTIHFRCKTGGIMIHDCPFTGWTDHGFYNLNPTLFWDLSAANHYEILRMAIGDIGAKTLQNIESREHVHELAKNKRLPENSELFVVLRKTTDAPFQIPVQGIYSNGLSEQAREAWATLR